MVSVLQPRVGCCTLHFFVTSTQSLDFQREPCVSHCGVVEQLSGCPGGVVPGVEGLCSEGPRRQRDWDTQVF